MSFTEAWRGRVTVNIDGEELSFLGLDAMKKTKRAAGRTKDLLDLALLSELEGPTDTRAPVRRIKGKQPVARKKTKATKSRR